MEEGREQGKEKRWKKRRSIKDKVLKVREWKRGVKEEMKNTQL